MDPKRRKTSKNLTFLESKVRKCGLFRRDSLETWGHFMETRNIFGKQGHFFFGKYIPGKYEYLKETAARSEKAWVEQRLRRFSVGRRGHSVQSSLYMVMEGMMCVVVVLVTAAVWGVESSSPSEHLQTASHIFNKVLLLIKVFPGTLSTQNYDLRPWRFMCPIQWPIKFDSENNLIGFM